MVKEEHIKKSLIILIILALAVLSFFIARPFLPTVIGSLILAYIFHPLDVKLQKIVRNPSLSAAIISAVIVAIIVFLTWVTIPVLVRQTFGVYTSLQHFDFVSPLKKLGFLPTPEMTREFTVMINDTVLRAINSLMGEFENALTNLPGLLFHFIIMLFLFFYALRDRDQVMKNLRELSPFTESTEKKFVLKFSTVTRAVIYGMFLGGVIQGLITGIGLYIFGAPRALFLTLLAVLIGILPIIGTWAVWVPVSIGMISYGNVSGGIGLAIYNTVVGITVDFLIRPYIARKAGISVPVTLIGMFGGAYLFGIVGLIIGPLILSYLIIFLDFYRKKNLHELFGA